MPDPTSDRNDRLDAGPVRVRHLLKGLGPGGAERLVATQVGRTPAVSSFSYDVTYLLAHKDHLVGEIEAQGVVTHCLRASPGRAGWILRLRRLLRDDPVDVVHVHSPAVAAAVRLIRPTLPTRVRPVLVGTEHNRWPRHRRLTRWANRATIRAQDATIAVSNDVRATMSASAARRTAVLVHGIDLERVQASADRIGVRAELGVGADDVLVMCVANLRREKALEILVAAAARAVADEPSLLYATVGQGPLSAELEALVEAQGLGARFRMLGYRPDATRLLSGADVFTLSSRHEGLPVALMEALALGLPVAATAAGGVPEAAGRAGVIVPVDDPEALAAAHVDLARDAGRRAELADAAQAEAERFSVDRAAEALEAIYAATLTRPGDDLAPSSHS